MSATYGGMYEWAIRNLTAATLAPFSVIKVAGWSYVQGEVVLSGVAATESGPHAVVGAIAIAPNEVGACAFPGAHWAETEASYSSGTEVGPFSGRSRLTNQGTGFVTVGGRAANNQVLVAVRGKGGEKTDVISFGLEQDKLRKDQYAKARRLLQDGTLEQDSAGVDLSFYVFDQDGIWEGFAETAGGPAGPDRAHHGEAVKFTDDFQVDGASTGLRGYYILRLETRAQFIFVKLAEDQASGSGATSCKYEGDPPISGPPSMEILRGPVSSSYDVLVYNDLEMAKDAKQDDLWVAVYTYPAGGEEGRYNFAIRSPITLTNPNTTAWVLIKGTIPEQDDPTNTSGPLAIVINGELTGTQLFTPVRLEKDFDKVNHTFTEGALLLDYEGRPVIEPDPEFIPTFPGEPPPLVLAVRDVMVSGATGFKGFGEGLKSTAIIIQEEYLPLGALPGEERKRELAIVTWDENRGHETFVKGVQATGVDDPDLQILFHSGGENVFKLSSADCAG